MTGPYGVTIPCPNCGKEIGMGFESNAGQIVCAECWHKQDVSWKSWEEELTDGGA
jgi:hypothetical protein